MSIAAQSNNRATGAVAVLLVLLLCAAGGAFAGISILETKQIELDALQTQLGNLKRHRPPAAATESDAKILVKPFLTEENFALAANALQRRVVGLIEETDGKLITVGVDPPVTGDAELARRVSVQVTAELTNEALQKVLYELENSVPFAFVESFSATRKDTGEGTGNTGNTETGVEPPLSVSLNVTGYRRKGSR
jgi:Type II secretion system (T2SS), protein M subtype b